MKKISAIRVNQLSNYSIFVVGVLLAVWLRFSLKNYESVDFTSYLQPWYDFIVQQNGFAALKYHFTNYAPPYTYWLVVAATVLRSMQAVVAVKLLAASVDFLCAFFVYKIVRLKYSSKKIAIAAFFAVLFSPTVFLNSSYWGQCDVIYTTGTIACLYFLLVRRELLAFICFGLAFSFKQQALFFFPFLLALLVRRKISWFIVPTVFWVYFLTVLPAWIAGRSLQDLFSVYAKQTEAYRDLTKECPNIYQWLSDQFYDFLVPAGIALTLIIVSCFVWSIYKSQIAIHREQMIQLALTSALLMPYFLPKMHDRYFFMADILAIVFGFYFPKYFWVPVVVQLSSLLSYAPVLVGESIVSLKVLSIVMGGVICFMVRLHTTTFYPPQSDRSL